MLQSFILERVVMPAKLVKHFLAIFIHSFVYARPRMAARHPLTMAMYCVRFVGHRWG